MLDQGLAFTVDNSSVNGRHLPMLNSPTISKRVLRLTAVAACMFVSAPSAQAQAFTDAEEFRGAHEILSISASTARLALALSFDAATHGQLGLRRILDDDLVQIGKLGASYLAERQTPTTEQFMLRIPGTHLALSDGRAWLRRVSEARRTRGAYVSLGLTY